MSVNLALLWLVDPGRADITLTQARATSFGIGNLAFITRAGIEVLLGQAAGIVISLLVAFSLVALVAAGTMLAASAHADVQRRLPAFGVRRALGFTPGRLAAGQAAEAALLAAPAAALGLVAGALAVAGPSGGAARAAQRAAARRRAAAGARRLPGSRSPRSSRPRRPGRPGARPAARRRRSCAAATWPAPGAGATQRA